MTKQYTISRQPTELYIVDVEFAGTESVRRSSFILNLPVPLLPDPMRAVKANLHWIYDILDPDIDFKVLDVKLFDPEHNAHIASSTKARTHKRSRQHERQAALCSCDPLRSCTASRIPDLHGDADLSNIPMRTPRSEGAA